MQTLVQFIMTMSDPTLRELINDDRIFEEFDYDLRYGSPPHYNSISILPVEIQLRLMQAFVDKNESANEENPDRYPNIRFVPTNCFSPNHAFVSSTCFPFDDNIEQERPRAAREANLADAIARVAFDNGLTSTDVYCLLPAILRMLNSKSVNTK